MKKILAIVTVILMMVSCKSKPPLKTYFSDAYSYCKTVKALNEVVMDNNFPPMIASRNYVYANIAAYECVAAGNPTQYNSLDGQLKDFTDKIKPTTKLIDFNFASLLAFCRVGEAVTFPEGSMKDYVDSLKNTAKQNGMPSGMFDNSVAFADSIAKNVIAWSKKDNYAQLRSATKYTVIDKPGRWVPTPPMYAQAVEPHWAEMRTIGIDSANQFPPPPPIAYNMDDKNSAYYKQVVQIKTAIDSLTDEQKHMASFWDDLGTRLNVSGHLQFLTKKFSPVGHWMSITGIASQKDKANFDKTVYGFALTSICVYDAFIQCWSEKFRSNTVRPETVINKTIDPNWQPYLQTPPFPEYTCGHSTISSSAAQALTKVYGDNFAYTDTSELEFGIKSRSFSSFRAAALENTWARFYGGIHYHPSCIAGTQCGKNVGDFIIDKIKMKK